MIVNLFFEASTRTRTSFEIAAKRLGADAISITASGSSVSKGESLVDTLNTLGAMRPDAIVMRHSASGAPHFLARHLGIPIINAGDGTHEHPTQALLDARTILDRRQTLEGLRVAIIGDIAHSRVARSNMYLLSKFGADIVLCGPASLLPVELKQLAPGVTLTTTWTKRSRDADVIMMLRVQLERQHEAAFPAERILPVLRTAAGASEAGEAGRDRDASGADQSRPRDFVRGGGFAAIGDSESGGERDCGAHGGAGTSAEWRRNAGAAH